MGWISLRILLCPSTGIEPTAQGTPVLQPIDQAIVG
jgi:hypothetical protein